MSGGNLAGDRQSSIDHQLFDLLKAVVAAVRGGAVSEGSGHVQSGSVTGHAYALLVCDRPRAVGHGIGAAERRLKGRSDRPSWF